MVKAYLYLQRDSVPSPPWNWYQGTCVGYHLKLDIRMHPCYYRQGMYIPDKRDCHLPKVHNRWQHLYLLLVLHYAVRVNWRRHREETMHLFRKFNLSRATKHKHMLCSMLMYCPQNNLSCLCCITVVDRWYNSLHNCDQPGGKGTPAMGIQYSRINI